MNKLFLILAASAILFACGGGGNKNTSTTEKYNDEEELVENDFDDVLDAYEELVDEHIELYNRVRHSRSKDDRLELREMADLRSEYESEISELVDQMSAAQADRFNKINQRFMSSGGM